MKHGNGKKYWINLNIDHLQGEVLANFPNFGLISKLGPKDQCLASFLGLAGLARYSNLDLAKNRIILQNFQFWTDSRSSRIAIKHKKQFGIAKYKVRLRKMAYICHRRKVCTDKDKPFVKQMFCKVKKLV